MYEKIPGLGVHFVLLLNPYLVVFFTGFKTLLAVFINLFEMCLEDSSKIILLVVVT